MSKIDFTFCKENLKKKLKDRKRVKGICFSYSKDKDDSFDASKKKEKKSIPHFSYDKEIKTLIENFKNIKNEIIIIEQKDREEKMRKNQKKLLVDKEIMTFNKIYEHIGILFKNYNRKKNKNKYFLQKSKIFTDYNNKNRVFSAEKKNRLFQKISFNFYNAVNKTELGRKINEEDNSETFKKYKKFFDFLIFYKRNNSEKKMKNDKLKSSNIYMNIYGNNYKKNKKQQTIDNSNYYLTENLINNNYENSINEKIITNITETDKTINNSNNYTRFIKRAKELNAKNKLIKRINTLPTQYIKENICPNLKNEKLILNISEVSSYNKKKKKNLFLKSSKNLISNQYYNFMNTNDFSPKLYKHLGSTKNFRFTDIINKEPPLKTLSILSANNSKTSNKQMKNFQTIPFYDDTEGNKKRRAKSSKVRNKPMYLAKISDFVKKYNDIKDKIKTVKIKRKENHLLAYSDIEKAYDIKEEMLMFLLKDKYLNSQFPKKAIVKPNKRKMFLKNLLEKIDILENPFSSKLTNKND